MYIIRIFAFILCSSFISDGFAITLSKEATYYADSFEGSRTSNGEIFSQDGFTAAMCDISLGKNVYIASGNTGTIVRVNDRPNCSRYPNIIDLTKKSFSLFAPLSTGRIPGLTIDTLDVIDSSVFRSLGVELDPNIPSIYFAGDGFEVRGRVTDGKSTVLLFLQNQETKEEYSRIFPVNNDGSFLLPFTLPNISGEYSFVIASGNSFKTVKFGTIRLISRDYFVSPPFSPLDSMHIVPRIERIGKTSRISLGERLYGNLELRQDTKKFRLSGTSFIFDNFSYFRPGKADVTITGYAVGSGGSLDQTSGLSLLYTGSVILERTHESTGKNLVTMRNNKQSVTLKFRVPSTPKIRGTYYLTFPNGDVREFDYNSSLLTEDDFLIPGKMISLSLPTVDNGTYMIEIVKDDGTAYVNLPITRGMVWNIIQPYTKESIKNIRKNSDSIKKYAISRINSIRASLGRNLLLSDDFLSKIAQAKVDDMIARKYVGHRDPDNNLIRDFAKKGGMVYTGTIAENIAVGNVSDMVLQDGLEESGGHRHTMVAPAFIKVGFGYGISGDTVYVVQVFGDQ